MTEKIANYIVGIFGGLASGIMGKYLIVFIISLMPILELRGGLIAASLLGLPMWQSFLVCFIGNILPIPFILWFINPIFRHMRNWRHLGKVVLWCENKAHSKQEKIARLQYIGLFLFVGVPVPGTGAWMGCLIAALLDMDKKKSLIAAFLGVILAGIIMLLFSYGLLGGILR